MVPCFLQVDSKYSDQTWCSCQFVDLVRLGLLDRRQRGKEREDRKVDLVMTLAQLL